MLSRDLDVDVATRQSSRLVLQVQQAVHQLVHVRVVRIPRDPGRRSALMADSIPP
jgi:hypothetical protein